MNIADEIRQKLTSRKHNGWHKLIQQHGAKTVQRELINVVAQSLRSGKDPRRVREALNEVLFGSCSINDFDVLIRLKE